MLQKREDEKTKSRTRIMSDNHQPIHIDEFLEDNGGIDNMGRGLFYNQDKAVSDFTSPFEN